MQNEPNNKRYIPPQSPYKRSMWIDALDIIYKIAFFIIIIIGFIVCIELSSNGYDEGLSVIFFVVSVLIAVLTVGFVIVFLDIAKDIRNITSYVHVIGAMMIEDKEQRANKIENIQDKIHIGSQQEEK